MSNQSLFLIMSLIFVVASNMDYEDAQRLREANRPVSSDASAASLMHTNDRHPA